jgi:hypothetical protein
MLFQKGVFRLRLTPDRLQEIDGRAYPLLYPLMTQGAESAAFDPLPTDALVQNVNHLQTLLKDPRIVLKSVVFKGDLEELKAVYEALPLTIHELKIGVEIPIGTTVDLSRHEQLKNCKS